MHPKQRKVERTGREKRISKNSQEAASEGQPSVAQPSVGPGQESEPDWITEDDAESLLLALFSFKPWRFTTFAQIAEDCPVVWKRALEVFHGDRATARKWLETHSAAFKGKCPYTVALQVGGERKVLRELQKLC